MIKEKETLDLIIKRNYPKGFYFLSILNLSKGPLLKDQLCKEVIKAYKATEKKDLTLSRRIFERIIWRLDGAGLINITDIATAYCYSLSPFGLYLLDYYNHKVET